MIRNTTVDIIPYNDDNYGYVVYNDDKNAILIDPGGGKVFIDFMKERFINPCFILNTHHHNDHISGNSIIKSETGALIANYGINVEIIDEVEVVLEARANVLGMDIDIISTPGHTSGHVMFLFPDNKYLFCGDILFSAGCGRIFDGSYEELYSSLQKIKNLDNDTTIFCGHEYTLRNILFALTVDKDNEDLQMFYNEAKDLRSRNIPTIPVKLWREKLINPFLRTDDITIKRNLGLTNSDEITVFKKLRSMRNDFRI